MELLILGVAALALFAFAGGGGGAATPLPPFLIMPTLTPTSPGANVLVAFNVPPPLGPSTVQAMVLSGDAANGYLVQVTSPVPTPGIPLKAGDKLTVPASAIASSN